MVRKAIYREIFSKTQGEKEVRREAKDMEEGGWGTSLIKAHIRARAREVTIKAKEKIRITGRQVSASNVEALTGELRAPS